MDFANPAETFENRLQRFCIATRSGSFTRVQVNDENFSAEAKPQEILK